MKVRRRPRADRLGREAETCYSEHVEQCLTTLRQRDNLSSVVTIVTRLRRSNNAAMKTEHRLRASDAYRCIVSQGSEADRVSRETVTPPVLERRLMSRADLPANGVRLIGTQGKGGTTGERPVTGRRSSALIWCPVVLFSPPSRGARERRPGTTTCEAGTNPARPVRMVSTVRSAEQQRGKRHGQTGQEWREAS